MDSVKLDLWLGKDEYALDHIGVAVESLEKALPFYKAMGWESVHTEIVESEKVKVAFLELKNNCRIELLESTSESGPISIFINKRGPGMHHFCLKVKDIYNSLAKLKAQNVQLINQEPKDGAHNCLVAFIHPKAAGGVLIELSQSRFKDEADMNQRGNI
jgi:methylmalonyl-CoA epimerase